MVEIRYILSVLAVAALIVSCSSDDEQLNEVTQTETNAVCITCSTQEAQSVLTRAGAVGQMNEGALQRYGIGVFAYYTGTDAWASVGSTTTPNFMYNQFVEYSPVGLDGSGNDVYGWVYSPTKYWPNDFSTGAVDASGATGSENGGKVSFFAYAPYSGNSVILSDVTYTFEPSSGRFKSSSDTYYDAQDDASGILRMTSNSNTGAPKVTYKWVSDADSQVDLLWGTRGKAAYEQAVGTEVASSATLNTDLVKQTTTEKVNFLFKHALSSFDIWVQRIYDEKTSTGNHPDNEVDTKIFVSKVSLTPAASFTTTADLDLSAGTWGGTVTTAAEASVLENSLIVEALRGTTSGDEAYIRDVELNKWSTTGTGVTETAARLNLATRSIIFIPQTVTLEPKLVYSFVTRDDNLQLGYLTDRDGHRYKRITQEVTGTPFAVELVGGKKYTMMCYIGVESVRFEVVSVEDWDFPIRLEPSVDGTSTQTIEKTVNED